MATGRGQNNVHHVKVGEHDYYADRVERRDSGNADDPSQWVFGYDDIVGLVFVVKQSEIDLEEIVGADTVPDRHGRNPVRDGTTG